MSDGTTTINHKEILPLLQEAQRKTGYITEADMIKIANTLGISRSDVYGVATFYTFLSVKPQGRNVIRICKSLPCHLRNGETIMEALEKELGVKPGETTADGKFTFTITNCIGECDQAPAMLVNDDVHGNLTPAKIAQILRTYK